MGGSVVSKLRATFAVTTPMFPGGADPKNGPPELRPPSIKGVLRFWWRALAWSRHSGNRPEIRDEEAKIFGAAGDGSSHGQASFILRVPPATTTPIAVDTVLNGTDGRVVAVGARYLGYGLMEAFGSRKTGKTEGQLSRRCLQAPFEFTLELISRATLDPSLVDALKLMGLLGGLGSRTRRGWGSLSLLSLEGNTEPWQPPSDRAAYVKALRDILCRTPLPDGEPPYSAFCKQTRIEVAGSGTDPLRLLNTVGEEMLRYRSWGRAGKVGNVKVDQEAFKGDHDWFKTSEKGIKISDGRPRRVMFGLPHNYSKKFGVTAENFDRRASPLLIHVHRLADASYIAVLTILRSDFFPRVERLKITSERTEAFRDAAPDWSVLEKFVDRFPESTRVLP